MYWKRRRKPAPAERLDLHAQPAPPGDDADGVDTWLRHCPTCGALAAGSYIVHLPHGMDGMCHRRRGVDCQRERVTLRHAAAVTGMSEEALLIEVYTSIGDPDNPMRVAAATRLGMAPPQPTERTFEQVGTQSVAVGFGR